MENKGEYYLISRTDLNGYYYVSFKDGATQWRESITAARKFQSFEEANNLIKHMKLTGWWRQEGVEVVRVTYTVQSVISY